MNERHKRGESRLITKMQGSHNKVSGIRGRDAQRPTHIPILGWWDILRRVFSKLGEQNASILAAGVAFYAMLAIFPALAAIVTLYALVSDPGDVQQHFNAISTFMPAQVHDIFDEQLTVLAAREQQELGIGLILGILFAIWSAHRGVDAVVRAITVSYKETETRNLLRINLLTFTLTFAAVLFSVAILFLLVALPIVIAYLPVPYWAATLGGIGRWLIFFGVVIFAISILYKYAPPRRPAKWRWLSGGALAATIMWFSGSLLFSYYVSNFNTYNETYGTLGAIIVLLMWFYLTSFAIIFGATLNAETEHQTAKDTTIGDQKPLGERGAYVADTVGKIP